MTDGPGATVVVLIGPPGAGKTTVGRQLARRRQWPVIDTDELVVEAEGTPIDEIFRTRGEQAFREIEADAVERSVTRARELARSGGGTGGPAAGVLSLGGGAVMTGRVQRCLTGLRDRGEGLVVFLEVGAQSVAHRLDHGAERPLLAGAAGQLERWKELVAEREETYRRLADLAVDTDTTPVPATADRIIAAVDARARRAGAVPAASRD